ncbi:MAG: DUF721 domain-containing protein [Microthrixaceae bacterium]
MEFRSDEPVPLEASLELLQRYMGSARPASVSVLQDTWGQVIGRRLAEVCELSSLHHGILVVSTADPAVAEQLRWMESDLRSAANSVIGCAEVTSVQIRVSPVDS